MKLHALALAAGLMVAGGAHAAVNNLALTGTLDLGDFGAPYTMYADGFSVSGAGTIDHSLTFTILTDLFAGSGVSVIYPEGTRARRGEMRPFKPAGAVTLLRAAPALAVVPMTIDESWRLLRHNLFPVPFGVRVRVHFGAPIPRQGADDGPAVLERAQREIEATLQRWRCSQSLS